MPEHNVAVVELLRFGQNSLVETVEHGPDAAGMREEQDRFMALLGQAPVRLTVEQAAWVLNCQAHDIPVLVAARLLARISA